MPLIACLLSKGSLGAVNFPLIIGLHDIACNGTIGKACSCAALLHCSLAALRIDLDRRL